METKIITLTPNEKKSEDIYFNNGQVSYKISEFLTDNTNAHNEDQSAGFFIYEFFNNEQGENKKPFTYKNINKDLTIESELAGIYFELNGTNEVSFKVNIS